MSIKFFSGLQDLLGLYDSSIASSTHTASPLPSTSGIFSPAGSAVVHHRRKSVGEHKQRFINSEDEQIAKCSHERKVRFDDDHLISGYCEASTPLFNSLNEACNASPDGAYFAEILLNYRTACKNLGISTIGSVERQIERFNHFSCKRQELFSLKGETVSAAQMEALEEIFRKVQFDMLDFEYTFLDDDAAIALSEMLEFYESAHKLNLSFNKRITIRGWHDLFKAVKNSNSLQMLNLRYTSLSEKPLSALCRVLRGTPQPILCSLHLENVNLHGRNLYNLVCALKFNSMLKELYLGENNLQSGDGIHLYHLISNNSTLQMLDLRNNHLTDGGVSKICEALRNPDVVKKSSITALVLWNNKITANGMDAIAGALCANFHLETLNIGNNSIGELGIQRLKSALGCNGSNLRRLGLQNTQMTCQSTILLAECLADNTSMVRVDLRDNPGIGSAGLLALHSAMKINSSISLLNLDQSCVVTSNVKVRPYQENFRRYYEDIKGYCERNRLALQQKVEVGTVDKKVDAPKISETVAENEKPGYSKTVPDAVLNVVLPSHSLLPTTESYCGSKEKFIRSSSLTCDETVSDIHERIRVMGGSTHSLDEINNDSTKTIRKFVVNPHNSMVLAEWRSLPSISDASLSVKPAVRKLRRFSISPSSSTFDVTSSTLISNQYHHDSSCRTTSLGGIPNVNSTRDSSLSSPTLPHVPESSDSRSSTSVKDDDSTFTTQQCTSEVSPKQEVRTSGKYSNLQWCSIFEDANNLIESAENEEISHRNVKHSSVISDNAMKDIRVVVNDLVNYVVYEESSVIERKHSLLLQATTFPANELIGLKESPKDSLKTKKIFTQPRIVDVTGGDGKSEDAIVAEVVRTLIREILRSEKEDLRKTLDRRRKRSGVNLSSNNV